MRRRVRGDIRRVRKHKKYKLKKQIEDKNWKKKQHKLEQTKNDIKDRHKKSEIMREKEVGENAWERECKWKKKMKINKGEKNTWKDKK